MDDESSFDLRRISIAAARVSALFETGDGQPVTVAEVAAAFAAFTGKEPTRALKDRIRSELQKGSSSDAPSSTGPGRPEGSKTAMVSSDQQSELTDLFVKLSTSRYYKVAVEDLNEVPSAAAQTPTASDDLSIEALLLTQDRDELKLLRKDKAATAVEHEAELEKLQRQHGLEFEQLERKSAFELQQIKNELTFEREDKKLLQAHAEAEQIADRETLEKMKQIALNRFF